MAALRSRMRGGVAAGFAGDGDDDIAGLGSMVSRLVACPPFAIVGDAEHE